MMLTQEQMDRLRLVAPLADMDGIRVIDQAEMVALLDMAETLLKIKEYCKKESTTALNNRRYEDAETQSMYSGMSMAFDDVVMQIERNNV